MSPIGVAAAVTAAIFQDTVTLLTIIAILLAVIVFLLATQPHPR
jgi:hypothetical protein